MNFCVCFIRFIFGLLLYLLFFFDFCDGLEFFFDVICMWVIFDCFYGYKLRFQNLLNFQNLWCNFIVFLFVDGGRLKYEVDGRVILVEFYFFWLLNIYVLNNGWKDEDNGFLR